MFDVPNSNFNWASFLRYYTCISFRNFTRRIKRKSFDVLLYTLSQLYKSNVNRKERRVLAFYPVRLNNSSNLTSFSIKTETDPFYLTFAAPVREGPGWILSAAASLASDGWECWGSPDQSNCKHCLICKLNPENSGLGSLIVATFDFSLQELWLAWKFAESSPSSSILFAHNGVKREVFVARNLIKQKQLPILIGSDYPWKLLAPLLEGAGHTECYITGETEDRGHNILPPYAMRGCQ